MFMFIRDAADWESKWLKTPFRAPYFINSDIDISVLIAGVLYADDMVGLVSHPSFYDCLGRLDSLLTPCLISIITTVVVQGSQPGRCTRTPPAAGGRRDGWKTPQIHAWASTASISVRSLHHFLKPPACCLLVPLLFSSPSAVPPTSSNRRQLM